MRKSLKDKRDPVAFEREQEIQAFLHQQVAAGKLLIYYLMLRRCSFHLLYFRYEPNTS